MAGDTDTLEHLKQALENHRRALEALEEALLAELDSRGRENGEQKLLSLSEVCQELGMGRSWVYQRIRSGEIPSIKLGHNIKVRSADLERYLNNQRYQPPGEE
jgi:excisionase family DNA binding protein